MRKARRQGGKYETKKYWHVYLIDNRYLWYLWTLLVCMYYRRYKWDVGWEWTGRWRNGTAAYTCYLWYLWMVLGLQDGEKVDIIKSRGGMPSSNSGILFVVLQLFGLGIVDYALAQDAINKYSGTNGYGQPYNGGYQNQQYNGYNQNQQPYNGGYNQNQQYGGYDQSQQYGGYNQSGNNPYSNGNDNNNPYNGQ